MWALIMSLTAYKGIGSSAIAVCTGLVCTSELDARVTGLCVPDPRRQYPVSREHQASHLHCHVCHAVALHLHALFLPMIMKMKTCKWVCERSSCARWECFSRKD